MSGLFRTFHEPPTRWAKVGTDRWAVPARVPAGGIAPSAEHCCVLKETAALIAPLNAARTAHRSVPIPRSEWFMATIHVQPLEVLPFHEPEPWSADLSPQELPSVKGVWSAPTLAWIT